MSTVCVVTPSECFGDVIHEFKTKVLIQNHETDKFTNIFNPGANPGHYWGGRYGADYDVDYTYVQIQIQFCETCGNIEMCNTFFSDNIKCKCNTECLQE